MSQIASGREPGTVGAAMDDRRLTAGIIADGLHVDPVNLRIAFRATGRERLMLVTDAMPSVGLADGRFTLLGARGHAGRGPPDHRRRHPGRGASDHGGGGAQRHER